MIQPERLSKNLEACFNRIYRENMKGLPIVNEALEVQAVGFREWNDHCIGILITPWFMNLALLPGKSEEWSILNQDSKQTHVLPARDIEFMVNEIEGLGYCQMSALYSPMSQFADQQDAVVVADRFMEELMVEVQRKEQNVEEERLARFLRGEEMGQVGKEKPADKNQPLEELINKPVSRRNLLRGGFPS